jgi:hypothetical protein
MQLVHTVAPNRRLFVNGALISRIAIGRVVQLFNSIANVRNNVERNIVSRYAGRGWNDSIERELAADIANYRCSHF